MGGTSGAAPQVAGVAALLLSREPTLTSAQVKTRITSNADYWGDPTQFGAGKLNAYRTLWNLHAGISGLSSITEAGTYTWTAAGSGGSGTYSYQWQESDDNGSTWSSDGATSRTDSRTVRSSESFWLRALVTSGTSVATSNAIKVSVSIGGK
jgi:subtilisin family serine protease